MASQNWQEELRHVLTYLLNEDEVRLLCYDLGIDYDSLSGSSKADKVTSLIEFCREHAIVSQLVGALWTRYPEIVIDISDRYAPDTGRRARLEVSLDSDIISFGNQKRTELTQDIAGLFGVDLEEIHVLAEASGSTKLILGLPRMDAENIALSCYLRDARYQALDAKFGIRRARVMGGQPAWWETIARWESHRFRGAMRLILYLSGFVVLILGGYALAHIRAPAERPAVLLVRGIAGALPGLLSWGALPFIVARFMNLLYDIGGGRDLFDYFFLAVFGPLRFRYPFVFIKEGLVDPKAQSIPQARPDGPGGPCALIIFNDSAVVLELAGQRVAVLGPSVYQTGRFERIHQVLDLRPQTRTTPLALAITRDGIPVRTRVGATYRIRWRGEPTAKSPYPADPDALIQAATAGLSVYQTQEGPAARSWADRVNGNLEAVLRTVVARYRLDELFEPHDTGLRPRADFERNYLEELRKSASSFGAEITEVRVEPFEFDTDLPVKQQWIDTWRAGWEGQARLREAQAEANALRMRELAQAYAQVEMIAAITRGVEPVTEGKSIPANLIVLRFIDVIRRMAASPESAIFLPHEAFQTLDGMRKMLEDARKEPQLSLKPAEAEKELEERSRTSDQGGSPPEGETGEPAGPAEQP